MTDFEDRMYVRKKIRDVKDLVDIAAAPGNYDFDPYMHGLANGLILVHAMLKGEEPVFLNPPERWGYEDLDDLKNNKNKYPVWIGRNN